MPITFYYKNKEGQPVSKLAGESVIDGRTVNFATDVDYIRFTNKNLNLNNVLVWEKNEPLLHVEADFVVYNSDDNQTITMDLTISITATEEDRKKIDWTKVKVVAKDYTVYGEENTQKLWYNNFWSESVVEGQYYVTAVIYYDDAKLYQFNLETSAGSHDIQVFDKTVWSTKMIERGIIKVQYYACTNSTGYYMLVAEVIDASPTLNSDRILIEEDGSAPSVGAPLHLVQKNNTTVAFEGNDDVKQNEYMVHFSIKYNGKFLPPVEQVHLVIPQVRDEAYVKTYTVE